MPTAPSRSAPPNLPPSVSLTAPAAGSSHTAPASITLAASASDSDGSIAAVEFYNGATLIGTGTLSGGSYALAWSNVPAGSYSLRARAVDNQGASADSAPVAVTVTAPPPPPVAAGVYYVYADHLNSPRVITDASNKIVWRWDSDPFGADAANEDPDGDGQKFSYNPRFPGQYYDRETGLHYNYFRDYEPGTGRYVEADPIGLEGGLNTYGYVGGNPISQVDPEGLMGRAGGRGTPNYPNGNWVPGYKRQDMVCTPPADRIDVNKCTKPCCIEHDLCYARHQCNASSWNGTFAPNYSKYACQQCNQEATACFSKAAVKPSCYEKEQCK